MGIKWFLNFIKGVENPKIKLFIASENSFLFTISISDDVKFDHLLTLLTVVRTWIVNLMKLVGVAVVGDIADVGSAAWSYNKGKTISLIY